MNNRQYDNGFTNTIVAIIGTLVRTLERSIVTFWDGLRSTTVHGTPSLLGFMAAIAPVLAPIPIATQTAISLMNYMNWLPFQAVIMAIVIEVAGFVLWVFLTEAIMQDGWKGSTTQFIFTGAVLAYQTILILINVSLAVNEGTNNTTAWILFLATCFPALCSIAYGYNNSASRTLLEAEQLEARTEADAAKAEAERRHQEQLEIDEKRHQEQLAIEERRYQEKRQDRKEAQALKMQYAAKSDGVQLEEKPAANKFRGRK